VTSTYNAGTGVWTASGAIADVNALLAGLTFTPALDFNSNFTIATSVSDGVAAPVTGTKNMTGVPVNDAPTATNLSAGETYTEDTPLDLTDIVVSDVDSANVTVTLTLSNTAAGSLNTGTSGAVTSTYNAGTGVWTASGAIADVNVLLAGLTFTPALNFNSNFTIATSVSDGVAAPVTGTKAMTGVPVNDAPVVNDQTLGPIAENSANGTLVGTVLATDIDGPPLAYSITAGNFGGAFAINAATGAITVANSTALDFETIPTFLLSVLVDDGIGGTDTATVTINLANVNEAPVVVVPGPQTGTEDTPLAVPGISVSDPDGNIASVTLSVGNGVVSVSLAGGATVSGGGNGTATVTLSGSQPQLNLALASLSYQGNANYFGPDTLSVDATDGTLTTTATVAITLNPASDAPALVGGNAVTYVENDPATAIDTGIVITDVDSATLASGTVQITGNYQPGQDVLGFANDGLTMGNIAAVFNGATGTLTLTSAGATATVAEWQAALRAVTYSNTSEAPSALTRTVSYSVDDGALVSNVVASTVAVTPVNDAPVTTGEAYVLAEDTPLVVGAAGILTNDTDVDGPALSAILVAGPANGVLVLNADGSFTYTPNADFNGPDSFTYQASDGAAASAITTVTLTVNPVNDAPVAGSDVYTVLEDGTLTVGAGAGILANDADVDGPALSSVLVSGPANGVLTLNADGSFTFTPNADFNGLDTFTYRATDGTLQSGLATVTITVTGLNDAPTQTVPGAQTIAEDNTLTFTAGGGNAIAIADVDAGAAPMRVTLDVTNGTLTLASTTGLSFLAGDGVNDATISLVGSLGDINTALSGLIYRPSADYYGPATLQITTDDQGASGSGGASSVTNTIAITVTPVNDAPVLGNNTLTIAQAGTLVFTNANLSATDVDDAGSSLIFTVDALANGRFELVSAPGVAVTQFTQAQITNGEVRFVQTGDSAPSYRIYVADASASVGPVAATITFIPQGGGFLPGPIGSGGGSGIGSTPASQDSGTSGSQTTAAQVSTGSVVNFVRPPSSADLDGGPEPAPVQGGSPPPVIVAQAAEKDGAGLETQKSSASGDPRNDRASLPETELVFDDPQPVASAPFRKLETDFMSRPAELEMPEGGQERRLEIVLDSVRISGLALSVGAVWWALRASGLIASLLASAPAWRHIDPLPVLGRGDEEEEEEDIEWGEPEDADAKRQEQAAGWVLEDKTNLMEQPR
jgi:VCBS repeat-containing protein